MLDSEQGLNEQALIDLLEGEQMNERKMKEQMQGRKGEKTGERSDGWTYRRVGGRKDRLMIKWGGGQDG